MKESVKKLTVAVAIVTIISLAIVVFNEVLVPEYLLHKFNVETRGTGAIGIIGGADGPTSIFISSKTSPRLITVLLALIFMIGLAFLLWAKKA